MSRRKDGKKQGSGFLYFILGVIVTLAYFNAPNLDLQGILNDSAIDPVGTFSLPINQDPSNPVADSAQQTRIVSGRVVSIADGDTVTVLDENNQQHRIRLAGIDTPERGQPFGQAARDAIGAMCFNRYVIVRVDETDRYGRLVGWIEVDGQSVNQRLLRDGMAWHYKQYNKSVTLAELEREAQQQRRGLWSDPNPIAPWQWRKRQRSR